MGARAAVRAEGAENPARGRRSPGARSQQPDASRTREAGVRCPAPRVRASPTPDSLGRAAMAPDPVPTPVPASAQHHQPRYFTWEEVAQHSGREKERWLVIDRKVYNISDFSRRHPGGSRVISHYAGQDATVSADNGRVCTTGGTLAAREISGPGMQARERPRLGIEARNRLTQTKGCASVLCLWSLRRGLDPELG